MRACYRPKDVMKQLSFALMALIVLAAPGCETSPAVGDTGGDAAVDAGKSIDAGKSMDAAQALDVAGAMDSGDMDVVADAARQADAPTTDAGQDAATADTSSDLGGSLPCPPTRYAPYFAARPLVFAASFGRLNAAGKAYFCKDLYELEAKSRITIAEPAASAGCVEPTSCTYITPTADERNLILAAKYAHAIWLDRNAKVPWTLAKYSSAALDALFNPNVLFRNGTQFMSVVDYSPTQAWAYLMARNLVKADMKSSMIAVLDDLRTTDTKLEFVHGIANVDPVDTAYTLDEALRTRVKKTGGVTVRVSRRGCHSMSRVLLALLRAMNISGNEVHAGLWYGTGHSTPHWPALSLVIPHGDDLYQATLRATPAAALLTPESFYTAPANKAVCGTDRFCLGRRHADLNAIAYPAQYTTRRCCNPATYGYTTCSNYLTKNYATTLTSAEIATAATSLKASCP